MSSSKRHGSGAPKGTPKAAAPTPPSGAPKAGSKPTPASKAKRPPKAMPAGAEAIRAERAAARRANPELEPDEAVLQGPGVIASAVAGTVVFVVVAAAAAVVAGARIVAVGVDLLLMFGGCGLYFWGWAVAAGRSRESQISLWNLILLEDIAPRRVRVRLLGALAAQIVVAAATCWITPPLAFGWLVPVWGLAHCEYWGARYGAFRPRQADEVPRRRRR